MIFIGEMENKGINDLIFYPPHPIIQNIGFFLIRALFEDF